MAKRVKSDTSDPSAPEDPTTAEVPANVSTDAATTTDASEPSSGPAQGGIVETGAVVNLEELIKLANGLRTNSLYGWTGLSGEERFWRALGYSGKPHGQ